MSVIAAVVLLVLGVLALRRLRWAYVGFVALAVLWIPARTQFRLHSPDCQFATTLEDAARAAINVPHIVLFAIFFGMTLRQFSGPLGARLAGGGVATLTFGAVIELMQGATRTGNCQLHDLIPDAVGALLAAMVAILWLKVSRRPYLLN